MNSGALFEKAIRFIVSSCISSIIVYLILKFVRPGLFVGGIPAVKVLILMTFIILCWGYAMMGLWEKIEGKINV